MCINYSVGYHNKTSSTIMGHMGIISTMTDSILLVTSGYNISVDVERPWLHVSLHLFSSSHNDRGHMVVAP